MISDVNVEGVLDGVARCWPGLRVDGAVLAQALADRGIAHGSPHAIDVALACALAAGDKRALDVFEREIVPDVRGALVRLDRSGDLVDDVLQQVREKLLVADREPRIVEYRGRGPLRAWIQVIAIREALMMLRRTRNRPGDDPLLVAIESDPMLALTKRTYRAKFADAFRTALAGLAPRERALLRLCFVEGVGTERLAELYRVHRVTMFRWLCDARANLLDGIRARLIASAGIHADEVDSVIRAVASSLDVGW
jgi:RNA polymerase sigma-70 factor (ECF subfamily)